jgi:hypothetical protein
MCIVQAPFKRVRDILETGVGLEEMAGNAREIDRKPI